MSSDDKNGNVNEFGVRLTTGGNFELIEEGVHDYAIQGIAILGMVQSDLKNDKGEISSPAPRINVIFELPNEVYKDADGNDVTRTVSVDLTWSISKKGNYMNLVGNVLKKQMSENEMVEYADLEGLQKLLGKVGQLTVIHYKKKDGNTGYKVNPKGFVPRRSSAPPNKEGTKETFLFNPYNPDMEAWAKLNNWTKKSVMSAVNANSFPKELQEAWVKEQEEQENNDSQKESYNEGSKGTVPTIAEDGSTMSIE